MSAGHATADAPLADQAPPWIAQQAQTLLAQRGHAWLLQGPSGLGQFPLAMTLARTWLCEQPAPQGPCQRCASCHAVDVHTHADLAVLMPETDMLELGWPLAEKAQAEIDDKKRKPSKEIRVEAMRDAIEFAQRTSARGRGKVVLVYPAERMNSVTANALLKTLEEPPGQIRFVLASEAAHQLLPTIRSRCIGHNMQWPQPQDCLKWLHDQGVAPAAARVWLRAAGGRPADALALARSPLEAGAWSELPRAMARGDLAIVQNWSAAELVDALQKLCCDLMALSARAAPRFFEESDLPVNVSMAALVAWSKALFATARTVEHPFNAGLMSEALVSQARKALNSR